jgi:solute carrier family 35 protein E1
MLTVSGMLSFMQNLCAFTLIHKLTALSYAVTNATKRITVISVSLLTLHNPVTGANLFGMGLAVLGVFLYNRVIASCDD